MDYSYIILPIRVVIQSEKKLINVGAYLNKSRVFQLTIIK